MLPGSVGSGVAAGSGWADAGRRICCSSRLALSRSASTGWLLSPRPVPFTVMVSPGCQVDRQAGPAITAKVELPPLRFSVILMP